MRFVTYQDSRRTGRGVRTAEGIVATGYSDLREYLAAGEAAVADLDRRLAGGVTVRPDLMLTPLPERSQLICVGGTRSNSPLSSAAPPGTFPPPTTSTTCSATPSSTTSAPVT